MCRHSIIELAGQSSTAAANDKRRQKKIAHTSSSRGGRTEGARRALAHPLFWKLVNNASLAPHFFEVQLCCAPPLFETFCHPWTLILEGRDSKTQKRRKIYANPDCECLNNFSSLKPDMDIGLVFEQGFWRFYGMYFPCSMDNHYTA